jgi:hypothetical protein
MRPARRVLAVALAVLPLAGCGGSSGSPSTVPTTVPTSSAAGTPAAGPVALQRSGGIAGNRDAVTVAPDGSWRRTAKTGSPSTGTLSADQRARLARMAADPALRTEATRTVPETECADGFDYQLTAGSTKVAWRECGSATKPPAVASGIAVLLLNSTE